MRHTAPPAFAHESGPSTGLHRAPASEQAGDRGASQPHDPHRPFHSRSSQSHQGGCAVLRDIGASRARLCLRAFPRGRTDSFTRARPIRQAHSVQIHGQVVTNRPSSLPIVQFAVTRPSGGVA